MANSNLVSTLYFDGVDDMIDIEYNTELNPQTFTVEAWAMSDGGTDERSVLTSRPVNYRWGYMFYEASAFNKWEFWILNKNGNFEKLRGEEIQLGVWTHLAGTYDASSRKARFYVNGQVARWSQDGQMVEELTLDYIPAASTGAAHGDGPSNLLRIGSGATEGKTACQPGTYYFKGYIDEVRVWNKARTQQEIQADMNRRLTGQEANLVGYWRLTGVSGNAGEKIRDLTGKGLDGRVCQNIGVKSISGPEGLNPSTPTPTPSPAPVPVTGKFEIPLTSQEGIDFTNTNSTEISFTFSPSGNWKPATWLECNAAGITNFPYQINMKYPNNTSFSLLAVQKESNTVVAEVGGNTVITLKPGETLSFKVNDLPACYYDNTGNITVTWSANIPG